MSTAQKMELEVKQLLLFPVTLALILTLTHSLSLTHLHVEKSFLKTNIFRIWVRGDTALLFSDVPV